MVNLQAIKHQPNSNMAYAYSENDLYITLQTAKDDFLKVEVIIGDPHDYIPDDKGVYHWIIKSKPHIEMEKRYEDNLFSYYTISFKTTYYRAKYVFLLYTKDDIYFFSSKSLRKVDLELDDNLIYDNFEYFCFPYINEDDLIKPINWLKNTIWYQIFPERFYHHPQKDDQQKYLPWNSIEEGINNHMFFGGNLLGIIDKIPYLVSLGITGIYFTPIFDAPSAHKYDTRDYFKIDASFGTNEDFKLLVTKCHEAGIKVMLDAVFNHCGWEHPFWQDVVKKGKDSIYYDAFYIEKEPFINFSIKKGLPSYKGRIIPNYRTFAFTPYMPKIKTSHPIWEKYLLEVTKYWITEYDIDAWRLDVSNEVSHSFWRKFRSLCDSLKPNFYILGENWEEPTPWLGNDQMHSVMNYEIAYPIWNFFGFNSNHRIDAKEFSYTINHLLINYNHNTLQNTFNLIDSHDTMRILYRCNNNPDLVKLCYLFIFTFTGSPSIYYGDEIGLFGKTDPDNRRCMIWDENKQNHDLFTFFKRIITLRKENNDFHEVDIKWLYTDNLVLIYQKNNTYIILNNNQNDIIITLPEELSNKQFIDLYNNQTISFNNQLTLKPYIFYVLKGIANN